ncbi:MAG: hypothetical protein IPM74_01120 [Crocinitomicaceae bacterium]|nr:hypothetical protein [Crocinitomicaceae bacterium]MBK8924519.1 hypothetical protein [Crocinitomicaceae bacterium]
MKTIFFSLFALLISTISFSQEDNWILYKSVDGVNVYYKQTDCVTNDAPSQVAYIIKIENTLSVNISVEWDLAVWYNNQKQTEDIADGEEHYTIQVKSSETIEGDCTVPYGALYIFKDFITYVSPTKLTRFEFENIKVTRQ